MVKSDFMKKSLFESYHDKLENNFLKFKSQYISYNIL